MSDRIGLVTGSFDPVTKGHLDIITRATRLVDKLYVGIFYNPNKAGQFSIAQRQRMLEEALADYACVQVVVSENQLAVDFARGLGVTSFIRGLRNADDFSYEANMAFFNKGLAEEIETICLLTDPSLQYISSSRVRELLHFGADISPYVPESVVLEVEKMRENLEEI